MSASAVEFRRSSSCPELFLGHPATLLSPLVFTQYFNRQIDADEPEMDTSMDSSSSVEMVDESLPLSPIDETPPTSARQPSANPDAVATALASLPPSEEKEKHQDRTASDNARAKEAYWKVLNSNPGLSVAGDF